MTEQRINRLELLNGGELDKYNEEYEKVLESARYEYARTLAGGLVILAKKKKEPLSLIATQELEGVLNVTTENYDWVRESHMAGILGTLLKELPVTTYQSDLVRMPATERDRVAYLGALNLHSDIRIWELGRQLAFSEEKTAWMEQDSIEDFGGTIYYDGEKDLEFSKAPVYASKHPGHSDAW